MNSTCFLINILTFTLYLFLFLILLLYFLLPPLLSLSLFNSLSLLLSYSLTLLLSYSLTLLLSYSLTLLLSYSLTLLLSYSLTLLLFYFVTLLPYFFFTLLLFHFITFSLNYFFTLLLYHFITLILYYFTTVDATSIPVTPMPTVTWSETRFSLWRLTTSSSHPVQGQVWEISASFALYTFLWRFVTRSALVPLESVAILETVLASLSLRQYKQLSSGVHTLSSLFCICRANFNHIEHVTLA